MIKSLTFGIQRGFSKIKIPVILIEDLPHLGFKGQIVKVKPGYAETELLPQRIAVYDFPGVYNRLFPEVDLEEIQRKKDEYDTQLFSEKLNKMKITIHRSPSSTNPDYLKDPIRIKDIAERANKTLGLELNPSNFRIPDDLNRFGTHALDIDEYKTQRFTKKFNFKLRVTLSRKAK